MGRFVSEIERDMPASELLEWMEYERLEPWGSWRDNWHHALNASILANVNRDPKRKSTPFTVADFMYEDPESAQKRRDLAALAWFDSLEDS